MNRLLQLTPLLALLFLSACAATGPAGPQVEARRAQIAAEPRGDYYIGRRFFIERTHFWGYLRRPGQPWEQSRLVVMNERAARTPDRAPEIPSGSGPAHGYDHNCEYRVWGRYTGRKIYDPNSNLILPEFQAHRYEVHNPSPGWLFDPRERFNGSQLLRNEPDAIPR